MLGNIYLVWKIMGYADKLKFAAVIFLIVIASFSELLSIGAVVPFLGVATDPTLIFKYIDIINLIGWSGYSREKIVSYLAIVFIFLSILSALIRYYVIKFQVNIGHSIGARLTEYVYKKVIYAPYRYYLQANGPEIISTISIKINEVVGLVIIPIMIFVSSILTVMILVLSLFIYINKIILFSASLILTLYILFSYLYKNKIKKNSFIASKYTEILIRYLQESVGSIRDVILERTQEYYLKSLVDADKKQRHARATIHVIASTPKFFIEVLTLIGVALITLTIANSSESAIIESIPMLGLIALSIQKLLPTIQQAYANLTMIEGGQSSLDDVIKFIKKIDSSLEVSVKDREIIFNESIALENVSFSYKDSGKTTLEKININIYKGDVVGIIGESGSGKSTLVDIILGLIVPQEGNLVIDGVTVTKHHLKSWQKNIAHIPQDVYILDDSVKANISLSLAGGVIDSERVKNAIVGAQLEHTISKFPDGLDAKLGDRGKILSGGERQRFGIARALYKECSVLVMDEATSALDEETEANIINNIHKNKDLTIIMISHRMATLRKCNKIIKINKNGGLDLMNIEEIL